MKTYIIPAKQSNSGSIHDIADTCEREIKFPANHHHAVVLSSYYGGKGYTVHRTERAAIDKSKHLKDWSHQIIDTNGQVYIVDCNDNLAEADR